jgi:hypothetical protein
VPSATTREGDTAGPALPAPARSAAARRVFGAGAGVLGAEGLAAYFYPALGEALGAAGVIIPLAIALVLVAAILRGSDQACDRVFACSAGLPTGPNRQHRSEPARTGQDGELDQVTE